jgi:hypothetical protein
MEIRKILAVVSQGESFDVYWLHHDERVMTLRPKLMRTVVRADGLARLETSVVRRFDRGWPKAVDGAVGNLQLIWEEDWSLWASPIVDGMLVYPEGKLVSSRTSYPRFQCHTDDCVVVLGGDSPVATFFDRDGNLTGAPIVLPYTVYPPTVDLSPEGVLSISETLSEARLSLVRRDGVVRYDVPLRADSALFRPGSLEVVFNGAEHVVAFVDEEVSPDELHIVKVATDGGVAEPVHIFTASRYDNPLRISSLAWNGESYLVSGGYINGGQAFLIRLDANLQPLGPVIYLDHFAPDIYVAGTRFVLAWSGASIAVVAEDGTMSAPLSIEPLATRRRSVR